MTCAAAPTPSTPAHASRWTPRPTRLPLVALVAFAASLAGILVAPVLREEAAAFRAELDAWAHPPPPPPGVPVFRDTGAWPAVTGSVSETLSFPPALPFGGYAVHGAGNRVVLRMDKDGNVTLNGDLTVRGRVIYEREMPAITAAGGERP